MFHSPDRLPNDLEYTIELAQEAQKRGMKFLLDYHYADSWADPQATVDAEGMGRTGVRGTQGFCV
ncbi:MAG: glycosyl hydrolase 53 family protein [Gracilimonas sp.]|nr:glycosyl hydrolase 53 family protein [Gracilimonas sp.]